MTAGSLSRPHAPRWQEPERRWTDDDLLAMWHVGREYERRLVAEATDDAIAAVLTATPRPTLEERIGERLAEMEQAAKRVAASMGRVYAPFMGGLPIPPEYVGSLAEAESEWRTIAENWARDYPDDLRTDLEVSTLLGLSEARVRAARRGHHQHRAAAA